MVLCFGSIFLLFTQIDATSNTSTLLQNKETNRPFVIIGGSTSGGDVPVTPISSFDIDILSNPELPSFIEVPSLGDIATRRIGIAYVGSNPSYEARLKTTNPNIEIKSIDLKDNQGQIFNDIPFRITPLTDSQDKVILSLGIPDNIVIGEATFTLNLADVSTLTGQIQIIDFFETHIPGKKKSIEKPVIARVSAIHNEDSLTINVLGKEFIGRRIFYKINNNTKYFESSQNTTNTILTILPRSIDVEPTKIIVSRDGRIIKAKFKLLEKIQNKTKATLVVSTPRGIISFPFEIKS